MQVRILAVVVLMVLGSTVEAQFPNEGYPKQQVSSEHQAQKPFGGSNSLLRIIKQEGDLPVHGGSGRNDPFDPLLSDPLSFFDLSGLGTSAELVNMWLQKDPVETGPFIDFGLGLPAGARPNTVSQNILDNAIKEKISLAQPLLPKDPVGKAAPAVGPVIDQWLNTGRSAAGPLLDPGVGIDPFGDVSLEAVGRVDTLSSAHGHAMHNQEPQKQPVIKDPVLQGRRVIESILRGNSRVSIPSSVDLPYFGLDTVGRESSWRGDGHETPSVGGLPTAY